LLYGSPIVGAHRDDDRSRDSDSGGAPGAAVLSVANYNMHCGMDGWGRPYDYVGAIAALDADVVVLEEAWTALGDDDGGGGQAAEAARSLDYQLVTHTLGSGRRIRAQPGAPDSWLARPVWRAQNKPLYMDGVRAQSARVQATARWQEAEQGTWGIAILTRPSLVVEATQVLPMTTLRTDRVTRAALVVDLTVEGHPISVVGTHMSHLHMGSHRNWAELRRHMRSSARPDAVLAGDMNTWGPLVKRFMPGWRRAVVGPTWPTWRPHSQIDHILVRGVLRPVAGVVFPHSGSDHRPVRAELSLDGSGG
jgi:endonuclease/exonuclease/phosphatase family metal-dependent hydrolase